MNICEFDYLCGVKVLPDAFFKRWLLVCGKRGCIMPLFFLFIHSDVWHNICLSFSCPNYRYMTDIDFIRLSALVFATKLIGKTEDPIEEGMGLAERLFNKLKEKEAQ